MLTDDETRTEKFHRVIRNVAARLEPSNYSKYESTRNTLNSMLYPLFEELLNDIWKLSHEIMKLESGRLEE